MLGLPSAGAGAWTLWSMLALALFGPVLSQYCLRVNRAL
ncbi:hypothetical protein AB6Q85_000375 [Vibrio cholerae]|nr:hypothetical protein [Vibrio cholerae]EKF9419757.1 hypothetical protein [Vibrio cholerae]EKF9881490.1 hypothetical protein [Vibrio cholerae]